MTQEQKISTKAIAIGIDLGTTFSCVGVYQNGKVEILANDQGNRTTPSYVAFNDNEKLVGDAAKNQVNMNPENTVYDAKRLIGHKYDELKSEFKNLSYNISQENNNPRINVTYKGEKKVFTPEEISSFILTKMKNIAEQSLGEEVKNAVISEAQLQQLRNLGYVQ